MSPKRILKTILCILGGLFFVLGVPVLINCAYNYGASNPPIFITSWGAETVLSYYGSVLGAAITGASVFVTIRFTRKQIKRENYIKSETEKWAKVENAIGNILSENNPMPILKQDIDIGPNDTSIAINLFQKYQLNCRIATDQLISCINTNDYKKISTLVQQITEVADKLFQVSQKKYDKYTQQRQLEKRDNALMLLFIEEKHPNSLSQDEITEYQKIIEETDSFSLKDISISMGPITEEFFNIYETEFRPLLQLKGMTFESIYMQIQVSADAILSLWRK